ncbi:unnamed protein product [Spirodela intermedia]|uniref:CASP-like protein n=1 Tax=Spirodela intermedia TaxID=51605 RepID=A0ABN7E847_SPIIN|nr:unnamed protein product [Spirodela intermedia]
MEVAAAGKTPVEMESDAGYGRRSPPVNYFSADFSIRLLLFATSSPGSSSSPPASRRSEFERRGAVLTVRSAQFDHAPGLIVVTLVASATAVRKASPSTKLLLHLIILDAIQAVVSRGVELDEHADHGGVVAAATGAGGGVAYIGLKGNSHVNWNKISGVYDTFCRHVASAVGVSLIASIILVLLVILSAYSLYRRAH